MNGKWGWADFVVVGFVMLVCIVLGRLLHSEFFFGAVFGWAFAFYPKNDYASKQPNYREPVH